MHWKIHPPRPSRFPSGGDFAPLGPRDCPRASPSCNLSGLGVQNPHPWEISWASGGVFPNTSLLSAVYGLNTDHFQEVSHFESSVVMPGSERTKAHQCLRGQPAINTDNPSNKSMYSKPTGIQFKTNRNHVFPPFAFSVTPLWRNMGTRTLGHHYQWFHYLHLVLRVQPFECDYIHK